MTLSKENLCVGKMLKEESEASQGLRSTTSTNNHLGKHNK